MTYQYLAYFFIPMVLIGMKVSYNSPIHEP